MKKASASDFNGRFREIISDPLNMLIRKHPKAGTVEEGLVTLHNGLRVPVEGNASYYGSFSTVLVLNRGVHEPLEEFAFQHLLAQLPRAPVMLELGAYWGHYSMWLKQARPEASVYLVEPDAQHLQVGKDNFARHGFEAHFIHAAVGRTGFTVDQFLKTNGVDTLDVLHADIQGAEVTMLQDAAQGLRTGAIQRLFVSTHSQALHCQVRSLLKQHGYRIEISSDYDTGTTSYDGLIVATHPAAVPPLFPNFTPLTRVQIVQSTPEALVRYVSEALAAVQREGQ